MSIVPELIASSLSGHTSVCQSLDLEIGTAIAADSESSLKVNNAKFWRSHSIHRFRRVMGTIKNLALPASDRSERELKHSSYTINLVQHPGIYCPIQTICKDLSA